MEEETTTTDLSANLENHPERLLLFATMDSLRLQHNRMIFLSRKPGMRISIEYALHERYFYVYLSIIQGNNQTLNTVAINMETMDNKQIAAFANSVEGIFSSMLSTAQHWPNDDN